MSSEKYIELLLDKYMHDMKQSSTNMYYIDLYIDLHNHRSKLFNTLVSLFSVGGAALVFINDIIPSITCILVAAATIAKQFSTMLFAQPDTIAKLGQYRSYYHTHFYTLKDTFDKLYSDLISPQQAEETYNDILKQYAENNSQLSSMLGKINKSINKLASKKSDDLLTNLYYHANNQ